MALTKLTTNVQNIQNLADKPTESATQMKVLFDKAGTDIKDYLNNIHIPELESVTDGSSGADKVGMTPITAIGTQNTIQSLIEALVLILQSTTSNSGAKFTKAQSISGLAGNDVQTLLSALKTLIDTHKTSSDHDSKYFTETELGSITDGSSGADKIGATAIESSPTTVQGILEWLYAQILLIVTEGVADGSITDVKLSSITGQIKERVSTLTTNYNAHVATSSSETVKGHVELATVVETTTGTDNTRVVTPAGVKAVSDTLIPLSQKGANSGVAELESDGTIKQKVSSKKISYLPGDIRLFTKDYSSSSVPTNSASPTLAKFLELTMNVSGTFRVGFKAYSSSNSAYYIRVQIYRNGSPIGTLRTIQSVTSDSSIEFIEDLSFNTNDKFQLYGYYTDISFKGGVTEVSLSVLEEMS